jgi:hypothetical protein
MSTKNTGLSYEILTQKIFQHILDQKAVHNIEVKHNVHLQGKTLTHQIDVYWEFDAGAGISYKTIVQCKDWNTNPVKQEQLLTFKAILDDLPGQPRGIIVTRKGYQSGAQEFAKTHGILLYELKEPDWEGRLRTIDFFISFYSPSLTDYKFNQDMEWLLEQKKQQGSKQSGAIGQEMNLTSDQIEFFDDSGQTIKLHDITDTWIRDAGYQEIVSQHVTHVFSKPTYIKTNSPTMPNVKITSIEAKLSLSKTEREIKVDGPEIISFILRNVLEKTEVNIDSELKPVV